MLALNMLSSLNKDIIIIIIIIITCNYVVSVRVPLPLGAWNRLRYLIVAHTGPSI